MNLNYVCSLTGSTGHGFETNAYYWHLLKYKQYLRLWAAEAASLFLYWHFPYASTFSVYVGQISDKGGSRGFSLGTKCSSIYSVMQAAEPVTPVPSVW